MKVKAHATVQVTIEVREAAWGGDCSIEQLYDQAAEQALSRIKQAMNRTGEGYSVVGEPKVLGVITESA